MGSDLVPVPYKNGSYCRRMGEKLIVVVTNIGDDPADHDTHTKVIFGQGGVYGEQELPTATKGLTKANPPIELEFDRPKEECFDPDCEFYIIVDSKNELTNEKEEDKHNNKVRGVCFDKVPKPDLIPERFEATNHYFERVPSNATKLKVKIKNQGSATAGASKTKIEFAGSSTNPPQKNTPELDPGEEKVLEFDIPADKQAGTFTIRITADVEDKVTESNKDNNQVVDTWVVADAFF